MQRNIGVKPAYLAHLAQDGREQTVAEHLSGTADRCAVFSASFAAEEQGRLAGLAHDLGKYSDAFSAGSREVQSVWITPQPELQNAVNRGRSTLRLSWRGTTAGFPMAEGREITRMSPPFAAA